MTTATTTAAPRFATPKDAPLAARNALRLLENLRHGALTLYLPDGSQRRFGEHPQHHANQDAARQVGAENMQECAENRTLPCHVMLPGGWLRR